MTPAEREQLVSMSPAGRISHYLKKKIAGEISSKQYDDILEVVLQLPYTQTVSQGSEILPDSGGQRGRMDSTTVCFRSESGGHGGEPTDAVGENTDTPPVECTSEVFVSRLTDGAANVGKRDMDGQGREKDDKSQKAKLLTLLSDYNWHRTDEIDAVVYGSPGFKRSRISARVDDLRHDGYEITKAEHVEGSVYKYRMIEKGMRWITENIGSG